MTHATPKSRDLTIEPSPARWIDASRPCPSLTPDNTVRRFRRQLGLPDDAPVVMTGHQVGLWHPGILAKFLAARAFAQSAHAAHLVVDHDTNDPTLVRYPCRRTDGHLAAVEWAVDDPAHPTPPDTPVACRGPITPTRPTLPAGSVHAADCVRDGLERIHDALADHASAATLAEQFTLAVHDMLRPLIDPPQAVNATGIARTDLFAEVVDRMRRDPAACAAAYNDAVAIHPETGVRPLRAGELPLWRLDEGRRRPVHVDDLGSVDVGSLAPRALLLTGLIRMAGCDLFIHGTGGGGGGGGASDGSTKGYDHVTELWLGRWLDADLAPAAVVTATLLLPLADGPIPTRTDVARSVWLAHHACHSPAILGDHDAQLRKNELVERIARARAESRDPSPLFTQMHDLLAGVRADGAPALARLGADARRQRLRLEDAAILTDRTWPFPLYPTEDLLTLRDRIETAFAATPRVVTAPPNLCAGLPD